MNKEDRIKEQRDEGCPRNASNTITQKPLSFADIDTRIFDAILKGIFEHDDSGYFFGSLGGHRFYLERCAEAGFITQTGDPTEKGRARYSQGNLGELPECRWYYWDATV